ncbi:MAG: hypothetical protein M1840_003328 [Geoglossum simile]|nr:MAG: hypothetical protein M1840_003328 [Geoglossum simile]
MVSLSKEQHAAAKGPKSPYDQAREYIDCFEDWHSGANIKRGSLEVYESNFSIKIPLKEWFRLRNDLNYSEKDAKYPKYSYNSFTSTLIIQFMPSLVHESITSTFSDGFAIVKSTLPASIRTRIHTVTNQEYCGFGGQYRGSNKTPDLAIEFENAKGDPEPKFVLEIGFSETYEDLVQDAKMWLEGRRDTCVLVLANIQETPKYRCPVRHFDDEDFKQLGFPEFTELRASDFNLEDEYGPATYKGLVWVGKISAASIEIWKRDAVTGLATRNGSPIDLLGTTVPPPVKFQLADFLDINLESDRTIHFNLDDYKILIRGRIKALALFRCQNAICERLGKENLRDRDYIPSGSSE